MNFTQNNIENSHGTRHTVHGSFSLGTKRTEKKMRNRLESIEPNAMVDIFNAFSKKRTKSCVGSFVGIRHSLKILHVLFMGLVDKLWFVHYPSIIILYFVYASFSVHSDVFYCSCFFWCLLFSFVNKFNE